MPAPDISMVVKERSPHRRSGISPSTSPRAKVARGRWRPDSRSSSPSPQARTRDSSLPSMPSGPRTRSSSPGHHDHHDHHDHHKRRRRRKHRADGTEGSESLSDHETSRSAGERPKERHKDRDERRRYSILEDLPSPPGPYEEDKPWFKKKTLWASVATMATVLALVPASVSAKGSREAAAASMRAAKQSQRSADAVEKSANAVMNTTMAQGHMDCHGRYTGPPEHYVGGRGGGSRR